MNASTEQTSAQHQQAHEATRPGGPGTRWGQRHVKGVALIRSIAAIWLAVLGSIFCASGHWWGACFFALAAVVGWLAYKLPRSRGRW